MLNRLKIPLLLAFLVFLSLTVFELTVFLIPLVPFIYGWFSRDRLASSILGILPHILVLIYILLFLEGPNDQDISRITGSVIYWANLAFIGGTIGYLAALRTQGSLALSAVSAIVWTFILYSGLD